MIQFSSDLSLLDFVGVVKYWVKKINGPNNVLVNGSKETIVRSGHGAR